MIVHEDFIEGAQKLAKLNLQWNWVVSDPAQASSTNDGYLELKLHRPAPQQCPDPSAAHQPSTDSLRNALFDEEEDDSMAAAPIPLTVWAWTFHICYSRSYREPVLYFDGHTQSGAPLGIAEVETSMQASMLHADPPQQLAVTQEDHPFLSSRPFFMVHPCETGNAMELLLAEDPLGKNSNAADSEEVYNAAADPVQYLLAWLCLAGGPLRIAPPLEEIKSILG